jgi:phosphoglycerate dehydrogenase-like enzyme
VRRWASSAMAASGVSWFSPHVSGFLPSYDDRCCDLFAENLCRYLDGAPLLNLVDRAAGY